MKKLIISLFGSDIVPDMQCRQKEIVKYEFAYGDTIRTYAMYLPDTLQTERTTGDLHTATDPKHAGALV